MKNNAIILCSGIGRRMSPIPPVNKSLLNIRGEPNIVHTCRVLYKAGIKDIVIATNLQSTHELFKIQNDLCYELPGLNITIHTVKEYTTGCNNVVTMKSVSRYIGNTFVIEGDQYLIEDRVGFLRDTPYMNSIFFTQKRGPEDWEVISVGPSLKNASVVELLHSNENDGYCLTGVSYISRKDSIPVRVSLAGNQDDQIYWEEVLDFEKLSFISYNSPEPFTIEYDNIQDLVDNRLMTPSDIANLVDEEGRAQRLSSMTNTSYLVQHDGKPKALRIPGYGTNRFIDHTRERKMEEFVYQVSKDILPRSEYYSDNAVKLTEYLPREYEELSDLREIPLVVNRLKELHSILPSKELIDTCSINLEEELKAYEDIFKYLPNGFGDYERVRDRILKIVDKYPSLDIVHRDLVPGNILVDIKNKDVKLIDWEYSCVFNRLWDIASLICEYVDDIGTDSYSLEAVLSVVYANYHGKHSIMDVYLWIAVVDFVWASWSLAKQVLGDPVFDYGLRRYERCKNILRRYYKEI